MRPTRRSQNPLASPLNSLLGTEANVRLLRILALTPSELSPRELARRAELHPAGVRIAIERLVAQGLLDWVGSGVRQQVRWRSTHPLATALRTLFEAEATRLERLVDGLRHAAATLRPPAEAVWIESTDGPVDRHSVASLTVGFLVNSRETAAAGRHFRAALAPVEHAEDVTVELRAWTRADLAAAPAATHARLAEARPLFGLAPHLLLAPPAESKAPTRSGGHAARDAEGLALGRALARKLARDPALVARAQAWVRRRLADASSAEAQELQEWAQILETMSPARLRRFLVDAGPRATRLRQSLPFLHTLTAAERAAALTEAGCEA